MIVLPPFRKACAIKIKCEIFTMYYFIDFCISFKRKKNSTFEWPGNKERVQREKITKKTKQTKKNPISQFH